MVRRGRLRADRQPRRQRVAVYDRAGDGTLTPAGTYATGGKGGQLNGSVVDHLGSQGSLQYDASAGRLFAVNAGSNSVSVFEVHGDQLHLRQVIGSGGEFPVSIAVHGDLVYVLNARDGGSIQGYWLVAGGLVPIPDSRRVARAEPGRATPEFVNTPGDIAFSPNGRQLLVTTKANTNAIDVFAIEQLRAAVARRPLSTRRRATFRSPWRSPAGDQVDVGEAGPNAVASFRLAGNGTLTPIDSVGTGGAATCWLLDDGPVLFAGNAGSATESSVLSTRIRRLSLAATHEHRSRHGRCRHLARRALAVRPDRR